MSVNTVPAARSTRGQKAAGLTMIGVAIAILVGLAAPHVVYPVFLMKALCFALFASGFNLLLGYVGLLSFGHAAYFGFAAYICGHVVKVWGLSPEIGILLGTLTGAGLGLIIGGLAIRRQGIYFAMVTLAFAQMVFFLALQAPFTGGEDGIQGIPRGMLFGLISLHDDMTMYYVVFAIFLIGLLFIHRVIHSPFGQTLKAIRENEQRAISLGYDVNRYKLLAFVLSSGIAGLAGSTKALVFQIATLTDVHWHASGEVVLMTLLGGVGTVLGPTVGAFLVTGIQNYFAQVGAWVTIIQGGIFVACVLLFRRGIVGEYLAFMERRRSRKS
ncbi:branched-chain amino acid ABC transporter permease [Tistrella mobilis]|uniref:ABC-type branched-chain amino acid transport system, permease component n=1 Tax=Tistrella mobilis (strain KA081020-065) TaxID=1110502 RepID=I3TMI6_TISMK|nr:ABC-type branched-chain amino acid transport system, permease component [Tistrella mobilis KA081020-065]